MSRLLGNGLPPMAPQLNVASPLNDVQLLALVAAGCGRGTPVVCVSLARAIIVEAVGQAPQMIQEINAKKKALAAET